MTALFYFPSSQADTSRFFKGVTFEFVSILLSQVDRGGVACCHRLSQVLVRGSDTLCRIEGVIQGLLWIHSLNGRAPSTRRLSQQPSFRPPALLCTDAAPAAPPAAVQTPRAVRGSGCIAAFRMQPCICESVELCISACLRGEMPSLSAFPVAADGRTMMR